jgi:hypothetical protein
LSKILACKNALKFDVFNCFFLKLCSLAEDTGKESNGNDRFFTKKLSFSKESSLEKNIFVIFVFYSRFLTHFGVLTHSLWTKQ